MANPAEILIGNDRGIWRSTDAVGETGHGGSATDAMHFQNLNGSLGSLAEVVSISSAASLQSGLVAGLGVNGTAGLKADPAPTGWPQILTGYGGPVAIDPADSNKWYVNNLPGVSIYRCTSSAGCMASGFGTSPAVNDADVGGDGLTMTVPAPFLVDQLDPSQLLSGTCRVWRKPVSY